MCAADCQLILYLPVNLHLLNGPFQMCFFLVAF
jgi:hypothetical protein